MQMVSTVAVTRELNADQREGMLRHLLRQLENPTAPCREEKLNALRSLGVHGGYIADSYASSARRAGGEAT